MPSEFFNPADHLLDLVSVDPRSSQYDHSLTRVHGLTDKWKARQHTKESGEEGAGIASDTAVIKRGEGTTSMKVAFPVVLERTWKNLWRKKDVSISGRNGVCVDDFRHSSIDCYSHLCLVDCSSCSSSDLVGARPVCASTRFRILLRMLIN